MRKIIEEEVEKNKPKGIALEFAGYARAAVGLNAKGGKQVCFGLGGADTKWRLGNECDYVIEPQFTGRIVNGADKSSWGVVVMPGLYRTYEDPNGADRTWMDNLPAVFRQIYFFGENLPQLANGRVWGGKRYYDRLHLNINDQFLEIEDGDGAGIEDMQIGKSKLSVAFLMNPNSEANPVNGVSTANLAPFKLTARLTDIPTMPEGALQLWAAVYASSTSNDKAGDAGVTTVNGAPTRIRFAAYHTLNKMLGGSNLVGAKVEYDKNHLLWRAVVQQQLAFNAGHDSADVIGEFRSAKDRPDENTAYATNNWASIGGRVDHWLSGPFRVLVEAGYDRVFAAAGDDVGLFKATGCLAINAGDGPGNVPTFRIFYTHGFWNDVANQANLGVFALGQSGHRLAQVYGATATNGGSFGIQAEAWW
jgi:maltoporin